jgi:hypothetical protein
MATPKQPSPRALSPEIPVVSYPTPSVNDLLVVQDVDTRLPGYVPAKYGDAHPDFTTYPNLKLVYQTPLDNEANFMWVRRVYANNRFNQEAYNFALKYSGEDPTKPIYVRTYTLPRAGYTPVAKGTSDPVYPNAVLVEESTDRLKDDQTDGQLDSLFIKVTRVYETLPGPGLVTLKKGSAGSIPPKFQAARQVSVTKTTVAASTIPDDTTSTIVESSVEQASVAKALKTNSVLDTNLVTLVGNRVTPQQQVASVSESMVPTGGGSDTLSPDALTIEGSVEVLGNGQSVVTQVQAPSLFAENIYTADRPDPVPDKFKVAVPTTTTSDVEAGTAAAPTLGIGDLSKSEEQITVFKKRKRTTSRTNTNPVTLSSNKLTPQQQLGSVTETYDPTGTQAIAPSGLVVEANLEALGDGSTLLTQTTVDSVFAENQFSAERPDVLPAKFKVAIPTTTISDVEVGTAAAPTLGTGELAKSEEQITVFKKRKRTSSRASAQSVTLTGRKMTAQQQVGTVSETFDPTGTQDVAASELVVEASVESLGDGSTILTQTSVDSVFPETQLSTEKPLWGIPMKFKVASPPVKSSKVIAGVVDQTDVWLDPSDMDASAEQVTAFKKKVSKSSMVPQNITLTGYQTGTWGMETVTESLLSTAPTSPTGANGTKELSVDPLGDGRVVQKTILYGTGTTLTEIRTDETTGIRITMDKTIVDPTSALPTLTSQQRVDRQPIDKWNTIQIVSSLDTNSVPKTAETWNSVVHYSFPDVLLEAGAFYKTSSGGGGGSSGVNTTNAPADFRWDLSAKSNSAFDIRPEVYLKKKKGHNGPVNVVVTRNYLTSPPATTQTVTLIEPVYATIVVSGYGTSNSSMVSSSGIGTTAYVTSASSDSQLSSYVQVSEVGPFVWDSNTVFTTISVNPTGTGDGNTGTGTATSEYLSGVAGSGAATAAIFIPDSSAPLTAGNTLVIDAHVEKWRFGVWIQEIVTATYPS